MQSFFLAARLYVLLTIGLLIVSTTDPTYLGKGLRKLLLPIEIVFMALAGLGFIPIVTEQLFNILNAQTVRGVGGSRLHRVKLLAMPLFVSSLRGTRTMGLACEARCFGAHQWNNFIEGFEMSQCNKLTLAGLLVLTVAAAVTRFGFGLGVALVGTTK
jgi:energy-coupling factor transport system permease protein